MAKLLQTSRGVNTNVAKHTSQDWYLLVSIADILGVDPEEIVVPQGVSLVNLYKETTSGRVDKKELALCLTGTATGVQLDKLLVNACSTGLTHIVKALLMGELPCRLCTIINTLSTYTSLLVH